MQRYRRAVTVAFAVFTGLLAVGFYTTVLAAEQSGCVTCHLDKKMITQNLTPVKAKTSAMQSGTG